MDKKDRDKIALAIAALQLARQGVQYKREQDQKATPFAGVTNRWQDIKDYDWQQYLPQRFQVQKSHTGRNVAIGGAAVGLAAAGAYLAHRGKITERVQKVRAEHPQVTNQIVPLAKETAQAVKAGSQDAKETVAQLAKDKAKEQVDTHVVGPAKEKAVLYGSLGFLALTLYIIVIAALAAGLVVWMMS